MFGKSSSRRQGPVPVYRNEIESPSKASRSSKRSSARQSPSTTPVRPPKYSLAIMGPPPSQVPVGYPFQPSVLVSKRPSSSSRSRSSGSSSLVAVVSLLACDSGFAPTATPSGTLQGQRLFSSVHDLPRDYRDSLPGELKTNALGYVSFPNLMVARPGAYRLRVSLMKMPDSKSRSRDTETLMSVESQTFQVYTHPQYTN